MDFRWFITSGKMVHGAVACLAELEAAGADPALTGHYRVAVKAHLLDLSGDHEAARIHYKRAALAR